MIAVVLEGLGRLLFSVMNEQDVLNGMNNSIDLCGIKQNQIQEYQQGHKLTNENLTVILQYI